MRSVYKATSYIATEQAIYEDALKENGALPVRGVVLPLLSNGQIVALLRAWSLPRPIKKPPTETIEEDTPKSPLEKFFGGSLFSKAATEASKPGTALARRPAKPKTKTAGIGAITRAPSWAIVDDLLLEALGIKKKGDRPNTDPDWVSGMAAPELLELFWAALKKRAADLDAAGLLYAPIVVDWSMAAYKRTADQVWERLQRQASTAVTPPKPRAPAAQESTGWGGAILLIALLVAAGQASKKGRR